MEIIGDKNKLTGCNVKMTKKEVNSLYDKGDVYCILHMGANCFDPGENFDFISYIKNTSLILDDVFLKKFKTENIVINCETEKEATEFCKWMSENGIFSKKSWFDTYRSNTCYSVEGYYSDISFYEEEGYTIIKFKDCIIPDSYEEFIEYWKKGDTCVKFDNLEDKKKFTKQFDDECQDSYQFTAKYVLWYDEEWLHTDKPKPNHGIINYKDIKNWKEILLNNKNEVEDEISTYRVKDNLTLKDIIEADPCSGAFNQFYKDLMNDGYDATEIIAQDIRITNNMIEYPSIKENMEWCIDKGFIIEVKKFEPFNLTFRIEDGDTLLALWHRLNRRESVIYNDYENPTKRIPKEANNYGLWMTVDKEMYRIND